MLLHDRRLDFARDLVGHWLRIRGGDLVPFGRDVDPRELLPWLPYLGIADLAPEGAVFAVAGAVVKHRFGREIRHLKWRDLVPPILGHVGESARDSICRIPCGYYHKFTVVREEGVAPISAETLVLPLRHRDPAVPDAVIGFSHEIEGEPAGSLAGWLVSSSHIISLFCELVDIGAGLFAKPEPPRP